MGRDKRCKNCEHLVSKYKGQWLHWYITTGRPQRKRRIEGSRCYTNYGGSDCPCVNPEPIKVVIIDNNPLSIASYMEEHPGVLD